MIPSNSCQHFFFWNFAHLAAQLRCLAHISVRFDYRSEQTDYSMTFSRYLVVRITERAYNCCLIENGKVPASLPTLMAHRSVRRTSKHKIDARVPRVCLKWVTVWTLPGAEPNNIWWSIIFHPNNHHTVQSFKNIWHHLRKIMLLLKFLWSWVVTGAWFLCPSLWSE